MIEPYLNEQAPIKKLSKAKQNLSHKPWITPCLLNSIKTKNRPYRALVRSGSVVKRPIQSIKSTGIKLLIYWKSTKKYYRLQFLSCRSDSGKMWKLTNSLISFKENVCALQRNFLTLSNQTTQAIQTPCPIYSTPTLSQLDSN